MKQLASIAFCCVLGLVGFWALYPAGIPEQSDNLANTWLPLCPVGGMPINFADTLATDLGPIFFCCEHCIKKFRADPSQYSSQVAEERRRLAELTHVQVTCPVSGEVVDLEVFTEYEGRKVFFCGEACRKRFLADPTVYRERIAGTLWYQTRCPLTRNPIDPRVSAVLNTREKIYFCSNACRERFLADPAAWASRLAEQGLRLHQ